MFVGFNAHVPGEFYENRWLIVRVGQSLTTIARRQRGDVWRLHFSALRFAPLADIVVLTILAGPGATGGCDGEYFGARHVVGDGFLLDWVNMPGDDFSVDQEL